MPSVAFRYLPLRTAHGTLGVLGVHSRINSGDNTGLLTELNPDQLRLLDAFASQSGQALERAQLAEQARQVKLLKEAEKLQNALLNSISHDLRTPLVSITGVLSLLERDEQMDEKTRRNLVITAREEADRLNRLVGNLLDMTRLESGALQLKREACDVQDLIGSVLGQMESRLEGRNISTEIQPDIPLIPLDFVLIAHVLTNLLDNALKYSPGGSPLCIKAEVTGVDVKISVIDQGIGIPEEALTRVFDKFYRVKPFQHEQVTGTGLGLAICKGFVEAHGGRIWAESRAGLITPQEPARYPRPAPTGTVISIVIPTELPG